MFENNAGQLYQQSGKVNVVKYLIALVVSLGLSGLLGVGYGFLSHLIPFIYLIFLLLAGVFFLSMLVLGITTSMATSRNKIATVIFAVISSVFLLYNAWIGTVSSERSRVDLWDGFNFGASFDYLMYYASNQQMSIGRFGRSGSEFGEGMMMVIYVAEALIIVAGPTYMLASTKNYYCEACDTVFDSDEKYFMNVGTGLNRLKGGDLTELSESTQIRDTQFSTVPVGSRLVKVDTHQCE